MPRQSLTFFLRPFMSLVNVPADRNVLMLCSSLLPPHGPGPLLINGVAAGAIAIAMTGRGVDRESKLVGQILP